MSLKYGFCLCLLIAPVLASADAPRDDGRAEFEVVDCLVNPAVSGLVSCMPPEGRGSDTYRWDMGDGAYYTSTERTPYIYHTYQAPGEYTVTLTVEGPEASTTVQRALVIAEPLKDGSVSQLARHHDP